MIAEYNELLQESYHFKEGSDRKAAAEKPELMLITSHSMPVTVDNSIDNFARIYRKFSKRHDIEYDPFKGIERLRETQMSTRNLAFT